MALQPDGKIVVAGEAWGDFALARYNPNGSLDSTFDGDGKLTTDFSTSMDVSYAVTLQPDGKIIVAGYTLASGDYNFALARYNTDGSLDSTFDGDGKVITDFFGSYDLGKAVAVQPDGKIIVAGWAIVSGDANFALARYNTNGGLDNTFDGDGKLTTDFFADADYAYGVSLQPDGKIVVVGAVISGPNNVDFGLARYNTDGSLDNTFDSDGKLTTDFFAGANKAYAVALQPDGKIVVAGEADTGGHSDFALARYDSDGSLDATLDGDGKVTTIFFGYANVGNAVALQSDGRIVVAGEVDTGSMHSDFGLIRYNPDGSLDNTFDDDGKLTTDYNIGSDDLGFAVTLQSDGKIVVAGWSANDGDANFALACYGSEGSFTYDPNGQFDWLAAGAVATDTFTYVVSDGFLTDIATVSILINGVNDAPQVSAGSDQSVNEGQPENFSGAFVDPGYRVLQAAAVSWDFGDGSAASGLLIATHTYLDNGVFTVTLTVTDTLGGVGQDRLLVSVANAAPVLSPLPDQAAAVGEVVSVTGIFTDASLLDTHTVVIEWAPGVSETLNLPAGVSAFDFSYVYNAAGVYSVMVTVMDKDGGQQQQNFTVEVASAGKHLYLPLVTR